jgi:uncharacterized protein (DUF302 family)
MRPSTNSHTVPHTVNRLVIDALATFEDLRCRYETLVPDIDMAALTAVIETGNLDEVAHYTAERTPHSFARFWTFDPTPMMRLAGNRTEVITYMMGNNVIAETMFRHNPAIMLYAPLRTTIYQDSSGTTHLSTDQPSTRFASFGDPAITKVGMQLDTKLAELLALLDLPVPVELEHD